MSTITELTWSSMTSTVNQIKPKQDFLARLLFSDHETLSTETVEMSVLVGGREVAPLVRKNGAAVMVKGLDTTFQTVEAPNIRIKEPFTPSALLYGRQPGTIIFPSAGQQVSAIQAHIARDLANMSDLVDNAIELMVSQVLTGVISYSVEDQENFTITYPRTAAHNLTAASDWSTAATDQTLPDVMAVKRLMNTNAGLIPTDAIMEATGSNKFLALESTKADLDKNNYDIGRLSTENHFNAQGAIFLGTLHGIRWWEYSRTLTLADGSSASMIRTNRVEFVHAGPAAQNKLFYGAIPDMKAFQGRLFQAERFSKSWEEEDPSVLMALLHSRPLPVPRIPDSYVSLDIS